MDDGTKIQLIQLRNPWAHTEWTGPWSDGCDQWDANPKMKARIHAKRSPVWTVKCFDSTRLFIWDDTFKIFKMARNIHANPCRSSRFDQHFP